MTEVVSSSPPLRSAALRWEVQVRPRYKVEVAEKGPDVVFHFWPVYGRTEFQTDFPKIVERAFQDFFPRTADVRAEYHTARQASDFLQSDELPGSRRQPQPTLWVQAMGYAGRPMVDTILKGKLLDRIDHLLERG